MHQEALSRCFTKQLYGLPTVPLDGYMQGGHAWVVKKLIEAGAPPDKPIPRKITPLALAAEVSALLGNIM